MQASKKTQYWFSMDQPYNAMVYTMPSVEGVVYERGTRIPRQGLTFTVDDPDLEGVTFQLTRRDKLGIFAPEGLELESIIGIVKPCLDRAAGKPVRLTPLLSPSGVASKTEDNLELVGNTRLAIALGRCYDLLFDLNYLLSMTFRKSVAEDARRVKERLIVVRNLLLKYNLALKREELESEEKKTFAISLKDLLSGGVWWGEEVRQVRAERQVSAPPQPGQGAPRRPCEGRGVLFALPFQRGRGEAGRGTERSRPLNHGLTAKTRQIRIMRD